MKLIGSKQDDLSNQIFYVELGGRHYSLKVPEHFFQRSAMRWSAKGIHSFEETAEFMLEAVTDLRMAVYILCTVPIDGKMRRYLVWDKKHGVVYAMSIVGYQIGLVTVFDEKIGRFYHDTEDILLVVEENGIVRRTDDRETPSFCKKTGKQKARRYIT